tara:strand:+ start:114 stop:377 length:264 start_codon:yes stop_codon:yes gene_type:complete
MENQDATTQTNLQTVRDKIKSKKNLEIDINFSYRFIDSAKKEINDIEKFLWNNCQHDWIHLDDGDYYSKIKYHCSICNLYKNGYMYN